MPWEQMRNARLENDEVLLRVISAQDREQYRAIAFDEAIWRYFVFRVETDADLDRFMEEAARDLENGTRVVFSVTDKNANRIAGSTSYGNLAEKEKRLEIGWSWLGEAFRGTGINHWAKYLLLENAFERLGCERVEFKTDVLNRQARKGLLNIGAKEEGILRSYNFMPDNRRRDAVYYSVLKGEWPGVKRMLLSRRSSKVPQRAA
jgi:RimJ/RimL family protein N-acetyltransferase